MGGRVSNYGGIIKESSEHLCPSNNGVLNWKAGTQIYDVNIKYTRRDREKEILGRGFATKKRPGNMKLKWLKSSHANPCLQPVVASKKADPRSRVFEW